MIGSFGGKITQQVFGAPSPQASLVQPLLSGLVSSQATNMPTLTAVPGLNAPGIGQAMKIAQPGQSISLVGDGLFGCEFIAWADGKIFRFPAKRTWNDAAQLTIPTTALELTSQTIQAVPHSVMWIWPKSLVHGYGRPFKINAPYIVRTWPKYHYVGRTRVLRLRGRNLSIAPGAVRVSAKRGTDAPIDLEVVAATKYKVTVNLPLGFQAGEWVLQLYNGTGDQYGWSNQVAVTIAAALPVSATEFDVTTFAGANFDAKLAAAALAASAVPGSTVTVPAGDYYLLGTVGPDVLTYLQALAFPAWTANAPLVHLRGAGVGLTRIHKAGGNTNQYGVWLLLTAEGGTVKDITFTNASVMACGRGQEISYCNFQEWDGIGIYPKWADTNPVSFDTSMNLDVHHCQLDAHGGGPNINLGRGADIRVADCSFIGRFISGQYNKLGVRTGANYLNNGINTYGTRYLWVESNTFTSHNAVAGTVLTRAFAANWSADIGHFFENNTATACGAFEALTADKNTGEKFLCHGDVAHGISATVIAATETTTTISYNATVFASKSWGLDTINTAEVIATQTLSLIVTSGPAKAQYSPITSYVANDANTLTFTHGPYINLRPNPGDQISIRPAYRHMTFINNTIDDEPAPGHTNYDFNHSGFYSLETSLDVVIDGNYVANTLYGIVFNSGGGDGWVQCDAYIANNTIENLHRWFSGTFTAIYADTALGYTSGNRLWSMLHNVRNNIGDSADTGFWSGSGESGVLSTQFNGHAFHIFEDNTLSNIDWLPSTLDHSFYMAKAANRIWIHRNITDSPAAIQYIDQTATQEVLYEVV